MPAHVLNLEEHALLVEGFRQAPGNASAAARHAKVGRDTAARYWHRGAPNCPDARAKPISQVLAEEQEHARARLQQLLAETERLAAELEAKRRLETNQLAMKDATDARVQEAQVIRMARGAASALLANLTSLAKGSAKMGVKVGKQLEKMAADPADFTKGEMLDMTRVVATLASSLRQANDAAKQAMEMERLLLGEPTAITTHVHFGDVTMEEAERRLAAGMRALSRAKELGLVVDGKVISHPAALSSGAPAAKPSQEPAQQAPAPVPEPAAVH